MLNIVDHVFVFSRQNLHEVSVAVFVFVIIKKAYVYLFGLNHAIVFINYK